MSEFAPICIYLVISLLVSLIPLGVPFPFASNSLTYPRTFHIKSHSFPLPSHYSCVFLSSFYENQFS